MAGKLCHGEDQNQAINTRSAKSFCEGLNHRAQGTEVSFPVTDNPHEAASPDAVSWIRGWTIANDSAGGTVQAVSARCCAVPRHTILA